jgi:hypothetical protein
LAIPQAGKDAPSAKTCSQDGVPGRKKHNNCPERLTNPVIRSQRKPIRPHKGATKYILGTVVSNQEMVCTTSPRVHATYTLAGPWCVSACALPSLSKSDAEVSRLRLVSRCKKVCSLTGLPAFSPWPLPFCCPLGVGGAMCGIFSGLGCSRPTWVTPTSEALPALERA